MVLAVCLIAPPTRADDSPADPWTGFDDATPSADLDGTTLQLFTFRPARCTITGVLLVFHGLERNAGGYRDHARPPAQALCRLVVAPLFDEARYPAWRYQRGGLVKDELVQPAASWTVNLVPRLIALIRQKEGRPDLPVALIGHSAGDADRDCQPVHLGRAGYGQGRTLRVRQSL